MDLDAIEQTADPQDRARAASVAIAGAESQIASARRIRLVAIMEMARNGMSKPQIAEAAGVSLSTIRQMLR
jgi:DNA-binding NarL/FixJ family response regulator